MSAPCRHPHYGASSSRNRQWVRNADQNSAYDRGYDAYYHQPQQYAHPGEYRDPYAYQSDYYAAYPPTAYDAGYGHEGYGSAQGYSWRDGYAYDQAQGYGSQRQDGYDAQSYHQRAYDTATARYGYQAHARHSHAAMQSNEITNGAAAPAELKSVAGAPAVPKKMREAAAAVAEGPAWTGAYQPPPHVYNYNGFHPHQSQQQRDYHSYASGAPSSRYQPYARSAASGSAPGTPTHPSMYRPPHMQRQPAAIRAAPRQKYLEQAKQPSRELSEQEALDRKLLVVLDLNGTLVFRGKSGNGRALDSSRAVPRPFLFCFLQYCLGISNGNTATKGKELDATQRPHGSHFWSTNGDADNTRVYEPRSAGKAEVIVWSSAQPFNVDSMVRASFDESVRSQVLRVWARDTLVPQRFFQQKAESIKDLEIVWAELNSFAHNEPSPGRLLAQVRDVADQARPDDVAPASAPTAPAADNKFRERKDEEKMKNLKEQDEQKEEPVSAALEAAVRAEGLGPWGVENTVLVDDSVTKARLQPYNHLLIPEFGKEDAARMKKFIRQQLDNSSDGGAADDAAGAEAELEYDSDLSIVDGAVAATTAAATTNQVDTANDMDTATVDEPQPSVETRNEAAPADVAERKKKPIPESRLDDVLLQTIGVLETLRHQSNVSAFIHNGGIKGYGQPKTSLNESQKAEQVSAGLTPEFWAEEGRKVCAKLGIEVKAWVPGATASATAALL
ncbi:uncharacterized protein SPSC_04973 [Sporisorium scitamineum]|uniref:FCP1 homology domain-containing protein n=1 Tax=Sporisorium scitamineum TaxID=49012 RepID=A0A0F7RSF6_9BASI|nr:hypothetical protein [Sporisorium scitamineum]CDU25139.1 uncharacterized protein SPSC_04973 [Sporisorium scitamineum]